MSPGPGEEAASIGSIWERRYSRGYRTGGYPVSSLVEDFLSGWLPTDFPVLEVGCGTGRTYSHISALYRGRGAPWPLYAAVDLSPSALSAASARKGLDALRGDAFSLPFSTGLFSLVYSRNALHGYSDSSIEAYGIEIARVLKTGGILALDERGPLDRTGLPPPRTGRILGSPEFIRLLGSLEPLLWSDEIRKRRTRHSAMFVHGCSVVFVKK